ncbi:F-box protein CPR1-like isoform X2 [Papaver somniferum]|uniref:F-box protein CPR1-like isoform X2 n=1 Tax=Papaver somniferum TaxID=3469 RepID=UPI000E702A03|nr:F-box protein CPR1-like isoform X2 [Papaver somniferum]
MSVSSRTRSKLKQRDEAATSLLLNLPEEVHDEIFLKLPGKSILVSSEIMVNMPLPENIMPRTDYSGKVYKNVAVWGDCIGITCIWGSVKIDVWVMQEYGVKESWIKKYTTTQLPSRAQEILFWRPLWCFSNSEILIDTGGRRLFLYEPTTERVRLVLVHDFIMSNSRQSYVESIVSLGSATYLEKRITDEIVKYSK